MTTQRELDCGAEQNGNSLPGGWKIVRLDEVAEINPRRPSDLDRADHQPTTFVPMAAVDEQHGVIASAETKPYGKVKKGIYPLINILFIAVCAVICGADDFVAIAEFGRSKKSFLERFLDLTAGIPSHDRFNAIFRALNPPVA